MVFAIVTLACVLPLSPPAVIVRDAGAGGYEAFPDICRLQDGRLAVVCYAGYGHVALPNEALPKGGRIVIAFSSDEGATWSEPRTIIDTPDDDRDPSITQLSDGRLGCIFFSLRKDPDRKPPWHGLGTFWSESVDGGVTWSEPRLLFPNFYVSSPVREIPHEGKSILAVGLYHVRDGKSNGAVATSPDMGKTWNDPVLIDNEGIILDETDVILLTDGRWLASQRNSQTLCLAESSDQGRSWSPSRSIGFPGHCPYFHRAPTGEILLAIRLPKTQLTWSRDEGATWAEPVEVDNVIGAYPSMVTLRDGSILIVYYEEGEGSNIRARRFRMTTDGPEWLAVGKIDKSQ